MWRVRWSLGQIPLVCPNGNADDSDTYIMFALQCLYDSFAEHDIEATAIEDVRGSNHGISNNNNNLA